MGQLPAIGGGTTTCDVDDMKVTLGGPGSETIISVAVTPESGEAADVETYMITVYRERRNLETVNTLLQFRIIDANPSGDTYTGGIAPDGTVDHDDNTDTDERNYWDVLDSDDADRDVGYRVRSVIVSASPTDSAGGAVARITAPPDKDSTTAAHEIDLTAGAETTITVEVMAEDPAAPTRTYTARVYRQGLTLDDDAMLSSLMLSGVDLMYMDDNDMEMAGFMSDVMEYTADAPYSTMQTTVTAMANHIGAQSSIMVGTLDNATPRAFTAVDDANSEMDGHQVDLTTGDNEIVVQVMSEDGAETEHYIVTVTRAAAASDNAKLKSLKLMHGGEEVSLLTAKYWWNTLDCPQMKAVVGSGDMEGDMATYCVMYDDLSDAGKMKVDSVFAMSVEDAWNMIGCDADEAGGQDG